MKHTCMRVCLSVYLSVSVCVRVCVCPCPSVCADNLYALLIKYQLLKTSSKIRKKNWRATILAKITWDTKDEFTRVTLRLTINTSS